MDFSVRSLSAWTSQRYEESASQALPSCPPPGPELHFSFGGGGALVREGGFGAMLEKPEFVPMARPYASDIPIFLFISKTRLRKRGAKITPEPDMTNERTRPICTGAGCRRISGIEAFLEHVCQLLGP